MPPKPPRDRAVSFQKYTSITQRRCWGSPTMTAWRVKNRPQKRLPYLHLAASKHKHKKDKSGHMARESPHVRSGATPNSLATQSRRVRHGSHPYHIHFLLFSLAEVYKSIQLGRAA